MFYTTRRFLHFCKQSWLQAIQYIQTQTFSYKIFEALQGFVTLQSYRFYSVLFFSWFFLGILFLWNSAVIFTVFGLLFIIFVLAHGWLALGHALEDYTFSSDIARVFVTINLIILVRLLLLVVGL